MSWYQGSPICWVSTFKSISILSYSVNKLESCFLMKKHEGELWPRVTTRKLKSYDFGVNFSNVVQVFIYLMAKYEHHSFYIRWDTATSKWSFYNIKNLVMTSSMSSSFQKTGGFIYSLLPMYTVSFKFVQALLLFKIAGEGSEGIRNTRKKKT